ncbi:hypothetical protein HPP92_003222 [Vanilla planifolia]|uniref:Uncharacterized protein n=1 Tax=Vanilla planifolia TaxID=51239 RepID=A0A835RUH0_VANPL|nr:hypothetical protein HPP92_003222 [Vanilla planifolia]
MASEISISDDIHVFYEKVYNLGEAGAAGEPHLSFAFAYDVDCEKVESVTRHRVPIGCGTFDFPSSLVGLVRRAEPLPLEMMMDPEESETARERIAHVVSVLLLDCFEDVGLERLGVDVVVNVYTSEDEDRMGEGDGQIEGVELLQERKMGSVSLFRNAAGGERVNGGEEEKEKKACVG